jgi:hypothetical protein
MGTYVSAYDRLLKMPAVFSIDTMVRSSGMSRDTVKVLLSRWAANKLVESAGPRAGIYFNRIVDPKGEQANAVKALVMKYPSATLCGASVLHSTGWSTQIPSTLHVAIESRPSYAQIMGVTLFPKPLNWFRFMQDHGAWERNRGKGDPANEVTTYGLRALKPHWALADLYADRSGRAWHPDEDDLDIPDEEMAGVEKACKALGGAPNWLNAPDEDPVPTPVSRKNQPG